MIERWIYCSTCLLIPDRIVGGGFCKEASQDLIVSHVGSLFELLQFV